MKEEGGYPRQQDSGVTYEAALPPLKPLYDYVGSLLVLYFMREGWEMVALLV